MIVTGLRLATRGSGRGRTRIATPEGSSAPVQDPQLLCDRACLQARGGQLPEGGGGP